MQILLLTTIVRHWKKIEWYEFYYLLIRNGLLMSGNIFLICVLRLATPVHLCGMHFHQSVFMFVWLECQVFNSILVLERDNNVSFADTFRREQLFLKLSLLYFILFLSARIRNILDLKFIFKTNAFWSSIQSKQYRLID